MKISAFWYGYIVPCSWQVAAFEIWDSRGYDLNSASAGLFRDNWN
jgi:hypothetical protein